MKIVSSEKDKEQTIKLLEFIDYFHPGFKGDLIILVLEKDSHETLLSADVSFENKTCCTHIFQTSVEKSN